MFQPRRIVLVGASDRPGSAGAVLWENLSAYAGEVLPVTRSGLPVAGVRSYRSLLDVPGIVDLVVIVVPAGEVIDVVREAGVKGAEACVVISSGFAETGPAGARLQQELNEVARSSGVRIIGPNCLGVQHSAAGLNASLTRAGPARPGTISMVTQSGAYGMAMQTLAADEGMSFDKLIASGNRVDVTDTEMLAHLSRDGSGPLCFFLESLPDGRSFVELARQVTPLRPVILCRTGSSSAGQRAALSHSASLAGRPRIWSAAFAQAGIIQTRSGLEMLDAARALDAQPAPRGKRTGIVTNSGGVGVELTDLLALEEIDVPLLSQTLRASLESFLPPLASGANPVDLTTVWKRFPELYPAVIDVLARSGEVDSVVTVLLQRSATSPVTEAIADAVRRLRGEGVSIPIYACWVGSRDSLAQAAPLRDVGVPIFEWPERAARAIGHAVRHGLSGQPRAQSTEPVTANAGICDGWLDAADAAAVLTPFGVPLVRWVACDATKWAVPDAEELHRPIVLKAVHPELQHKSDVGAVVLGLAEDDEIEAAAQRLAKLRNGVTLLCQEQETGIEVIVGGIRDAEFGPVVLVGLGGVDVEATDDIQLALAPVTTTEAVAMIERLRGASTLLGGRRPGVAVGELAHVVQALGALLLSRTDVEEIDLNPVLARPDGCTVVDWRIRVSSSSREDERQPGPGESAGRVWSR
ncbi:acetate--CoA ligase family protein [Nocardioides pocheonensis]|uniref:acetate--CoA ligase family protein n=1 Tax=Nocardioides pocheonensis TaxID=661485 RepID=UPI001FEC002F|nr:acetate--CoA ligase [Nocardioides pocheonensis]